MTTKTTTSSEWLRAAVERSKGRSAPVFEEARRRGISQRAFHAALDAAGLDFAAFGERIVRRARAAAKPSGVPAGKAPSARPAKPSAAQQARALASFSAIANHLREKRVAAEAAAAAAAAAVAKPAAVKPKVQIDHLAAWRAHSTPPGNVFGGRRRERR